MVEVNSTEAENVWLTMTITCMSLNAMDPRDKRDPATPTIALVCTTALSYVINVAYKSSKGSKYMAVKYIDDWALKLWGDAK